ncbi:MAG: hypothetical protein QM653_02835 [Dysgonomonas sp.]|uniref:hypothetical protein n=1 Tax=Dysgonomonas sp. TaxID=1891233 RepID=UPI0039E61DE7
MEKKPERKMVIDGDSMKCIERFDEKDADEIYQKYSDMGIYEDIDFDVNGDLVLYREI